MPEPREKICANFLVADDPYHDYVNWRHFLRHWFVLGPFSFADKPYAAAGREQEALDETFVSDESTLQPTEDEEVNGSVWRRYSAVGVMSKWWELTPERVLLRHHHALRMKPTEPVPSPPGGVHLTIDYYTLEDELMPCWGDLEGHEAKEPFCPRCEKPILDRPDRCPHCEQRVGFYTSYSAWGYPRRSWWQPSFPFDQSVTYLAAHVHCPDGGRFNFRYSTNNPCLIWINGSEAARYDGPFLNISSNQTRKWDLFEAPVDLDEGWNTVVAKVVLSTARDGEACFCARLEREGRLCVNDFADEVVAHDHRLRLKVDEPTFIGQTSEMPWLCRMSDGSLVVSDYVSHDDGQSWERTPYPLCGFACIGFPDGLDMVFPLHTEPTSAGVFEGVAQRTTDGWRTVEEVPVTFRVPQTDGSMGEDGIVRGPGLNHGAVRLEDGTLLGSTYGYLRRDLVYTDIMNDGWDKYHHAFGIYKYSSWVMVSNDDARTWDYQGCIPPLPEWGDEGFCEPDLEVLENGDLVAILRNGEGNAPLWLSYSSDRGKSWTIPAKTRLNGQHPSLVRMSNGLLVACYGRPDNRLAISLDGRGDGFSHELIVSTAPGWQGVSAAEIAPDELFVVYEDLLWEPVRRDSWGGRYRSLVGSRVLIRRR